MHMSRKRLKHQYEFTIHVQDLKLPETYSPRLAVSCSRGTTIVSTPFSDGVGGRVTWNSDLRLETLMYYDMKTLSYSPKKLNVIVKQVKPNSDKSVAKTKGWAEIDLSSLTNATVPQQFALTLSGCSVPDALLNISVTGHQMATSTQTQNNDDEVASVFSDTSVASYNFSDISSLAPDRADYLDELLEDVAMPAELTAKNLQQFTDRQGNSPVRQPRFASPQRSRSVRAVCGRSSSIQMQRQQSAEWSGGALAHILKLKVDALTKEVELLRVQNEYLQTKGDRNDAPGFYQDEQHLVLVQELEQGRAQIKSLEDQLTLEKQAHIDTRNQFQADIQKARNQTEVHTESHLKERLQMEQFQQKRELELHRRIADLESAHSNLQRTHHKLTRKHDDTKAHLSKVKRQFSQVQDQLRETTKKYMGCLATLKASKSRLRKRVATQQSQIDDMEATLLMVRNSWSDTGQLMEKQIEDLTKELNETRVRLAIAEDNQRQMEAEVAPIRNHAQRLQLRREKTEDKLLQHEMTLAKQTVELTTLRTQLLAARGDNDHLKRTVARLTRAQSYTAEAGGNEMNSKSGMTLSRSRSMIMGGRGTTVVKLSPSQKALFKGESFTSRSSSISSYRNEDISPVISPRASFSASASAGNSRNGSLASVTSVASSLSDSGPPTRKILRASGRDLVSTYASSSLIDKSGVSNLAETFDEAASGCDGPLDRLSDLSGDEAEDMVDVE